MLSLTCIHDKEKKKCDLFKIKNKHRQQVNKFQIKKKTQLIITKMRSNQTKTMHHTREEINKKLTSTKVKVCQKCLQGSSPRKYVLKNNSNSHCRRP